MKKGEYKKCELCGKEFYEYPYQERRFCSRNCANKGNAELNSLSKRGKKNPMYKKKAWNHGLKMPDDLRIRHSMIKKRLYEQGIKMGFQKGNKTKSQYKKGHEGLERENNPSWIDGRSYEPYGENWTQELKEKIKKRDNYICQKCGKTQQEELDNRGYGLAVHHIDYDKKNCEELNLITLCQRCNNIVNGDRQYWTRYFKGLNMIYN